MSERTGVPAISRSTDLRSLAAALALLLGLAAAACGAPDAVPLEGPAADDVTASLESGTASFSHEGWDRLLAEGTRDGLVDYRYFQEHRAELEAYLERLAGADLASLHPDHLEALLINAYNAYTIQVILDHPHVSSIRDIDGVWTELRFPVGGHELTLDEIEHNLLRPYFRDPRVHFVLNCASLSCAPLPTWAFTGEELDAQYDRRTRDFLQDEENVRVEGGRLLLSRYFDWYGEDFVGEGWEPRAETIPLFVARYARPDVAEFVQQHDGRPPVSFLRYDWSLNDAVAPDPDVGAGALTAAGTGADMDAGPGGPGDAEEAGWVAALRDWVRGFGPAAPMIYGLIYVLAVVAFLPGSPLTIGAGVAFGLLWGTVLVSIASVVGAALAFLLARHVLRGRLETAMREGGELPMMGEERSARTWRFVELVDRAVGQKDWKIVALTRLSPAFPFNVQNYAYGLTKVSFRGYVLASWIAMLPGTLLYVYLGVAGAEVAAAATGAADWGRTALQIVGLLATLAVVVMVGRISTRALKEAAGEDALEAEDVEGARPTGPPVAP